MKNETGRTRAHISRNSFMASVLIAGFIFICFFSGCGKAPEAVEEVEPTGYRQEKNLATDTDSLYDISGMLPKMNGKKLVDYGFRTGSEIMLVYRSGEENDTEFNFTTYSLDINTEEVKELGYNFSVQVSEYGIEPALIMISASPLIMYNYITYELYLPENSKKVIKIPDNRTGDVFYINGKLYFAEYNGIISKVSDSGNLTEVFKLPDSFNNLFLVNSDKEDTIKISTTSYTGDVVKLEINVNDWSYEMYTQDDQFSSSQYFDSGILYGEEFDFGSDAKRVYTFDTETKKKKSVEIPFGDRVGFIMFSKSAIFGSLFAVSVCDQYQVIDKMYIWDTSESEEIDWSLPAKTEYKLPEITQDELKGKADRIEKKYGVVVRYGDDIRTEIMDYSFDTTDNKGRISQSLDVVEQTLALYPDDFFRNIEDGFLRETIIYFVAKLKPEKGADTISEAAGVTFDENGLMMIFLDIESSELYPSIIVHEITHVIDRRLEYDGALDETQWEALNPEDFSYNYAYINDEGADYTESADDEYTSYYDGAWEEKYENTYFVDTYAKTWPTEDRARLMESLIGSMEYKDDLFYSKHIQDKLDYFFEVIRNDLGSDSWPEETTWEKRLNEYKAE